MYLYSVIFVHMLFFLRMCILLIKSFHKCYVISDRYLLLRLALENSFHYHICIK